MCHDTRATSWSCVTLRNPIWITNTRAWSATASAKALRRRCSCCSDTGSDAVGEPERAGEGDEDELGLAAAGEAAGEDDSGGGFHADCAGELGREGDGVVGVGE